MHDQVSSTDTNKTWTTSDMVHLAIGAATYDMFNVLGGNWDPTDKKSVQ